MPPSSLPERYTRVYYTLRLPPGLRRVWHISDKYAINLVRNRENNGEKQVKKRES